MARWQYIETGIYLVSLGSMGGDHKNCSKAFFKKPGAGSRLDFADRAVRRSLALAKIASWTAIRDEVATFVRYRNCLAHFEIYHLTDAGRLSVTPQTRFNVVISENHMNSETRSTDLVRGLSVEMIDQNSESMRELAYKIFYFVTDCFPRDIFVGRGLLPIVEMQLDALRNSPRPSEFPVPDFVIDRTTES